VGDVVEHVVDDVLADPLLVGALEVDDRRAARELRRVLAVVVLELVGLDLDRQPGDVVVGAQSNAGY
jgi:anti-sigma-K factor RskA